MILEPLGTARKLFPRGTVSGNGCADLIRQPLANIRKLAVVRAQLGELLPMPRQAAEEIVARLLAKLILHALKLRFDVHHVRHVVFRQKLQQAQQKLRGARCARRVLDKPRDERFVLAGVLDNVQRFIRQAEAEAQLRRALRLLARNAHRSDDAVLVKLGLAIAYRAEAVQHLAVKRKIGSVLAELIGGHRYKYRLRAVLCRNDGAG